jgi:hypothetical protein
MSGVFQNIDPSPHPLTARRVCTPPPLVRGGGHTRWVERGGGSIFLKTPDTALYSTETVRLKVVDGTFKDLLFLSVFSEIVTSWF